MKRVLSVRKFAAWLCLAVILFGSGGAQLLHAIPGLGHHDHHCCHSHNHASKRAQTHSHCGHGHHHDHSHVSAVVLPTETATDFSAKRWTVGHHCVLCDIIAVLHHGTLLIEQPETSTATLSEQFYVCERSHQDWRRLGIPSPRGPPVS